MEFSRRELDAFLSKTDFDFSKVSDWEAFLAERRQGGAGRDADGLQLRDIKNYAVGVANVFTGSLVPARFTVRSLGSGHALAPAILYIYHSYAPKQKKVTSFYIGPPSSMLQLTVDVCSGGPVDIESWGSLYYIIIKSGDLPGQGLAEMAGKRALKQALRGSSWLLRGGFRLLPLGGAGYDVSLKIGDGSVTRDFMPQSIVSDGFMDRMDDAARRAWGALDG